jgi:hypothetical protein
MRKTMRTKIGASRRALLLPAFLLSAALLLPGADSYAVIAGTVFREPGFALARASVELTVLTAPPGAKKVRNQKTLSDARGEFAFRVPAGAAAYRLNVSSPGFASQQKEVRVAADERVDTYFELKSTPQ